MADDNLSKVTIAFGVDTLLWLVCRALRGNTEAIISDIKDCHHVKKGESLERLVRRADFQPSQNVAFSGTLEPMSESDIITIGSTKAVAYREITTRHVESKLRPEDPTGYRAQKTTMDYKFPSIYIKRDLGRAFYISPTVTREKILVDNLKNAHGVDNLFVTQNERLITVDSKSFITIKEAIIPMSLSLNFMGTVSFNHLQNQMILRVKFVGFRTVEDLIQKHLRDLDMARYFEYFFGAVGLVLGGYVLFAVARRRGYLSRRFDNNGLPPPERLLEGDENNPCSICMDYRANTIFPDCGHVTCCSNCAPVVTHCPICRQIIVTPPRAAYVNR